MDGRPPVLKGMSASRAYLSFLADPIACGRDLHQRLGPIFAVEPPVGRRQGRRAIFAAEEGLVAKILDDPDMFHTVGVTVVRGPEGSAQRRLRNGIVRMNGPEQKALRRAYGPALARNAILNQQSLLEDICRKEVAGWPRGTAFDGVAAVRQLVRRIAARLLFAATDDEDDDAMRIAAMLDRHSELQYRPGAMLMPLALPGTPYWTVLRYAETVEASLIAWLQAQGPEREGLLGKVSGLTDLSGAPMDLRAKAAQLWTLYGASFETTASTLSWLLLHLAWNPHVRHRLGAAVEEEAEAGSYLDGVLNETLRLTPPVAYQVRRAMGDGQLGPMRIDRGDRILISAHVMNRDAAVYPDPDVFRPERWFSRPATTLRPLAFSAGPRRCLGYHFAMIVMRAATKAMFDQASYDLVDKAEIGVRIAITQAPIRIPMVARARSERTRPAGFGGRASRQMGMRDRVNDG